MLTLDNLKPYPIRPRTPLSTKCEGHARPGLIMTQEEYAKAKHIILDLLGWGVPSEYLVHCGLSRRLLFYVFTELNLCLPSNLDTSDTASYYPPEEPVVLAARSVSQSPDYLELHRQSTPTCFCDDSAMTSREDGPLTLTTPFIHAIRLVPSPTHLVHSDVLRASEGTTDTTGRTPTHQYHFTSRSSSVRFNTSYHAPEWDVESPISTDYSRHIASASSVYFSESMHARPGHSYSTLSESPHNTLSTATHASIHPNDSNTEGYPVHSLRDDTSIITPYRSGVDMTCLPLDTQQRPFKRKRSVASDFFDLYPETKAVTPCDEQALYKLHQQSRARSSFVGHHEAKGGQDRLRGRKRLSRRVDKEDTDKSFKAHRKLKEHTQQHREPEASELGWTGHVRRRNEPAFQPSYPNNIPCSYVLR